MLVVDMVTTGTVTPSRKDMPEPLKRTKVEAEARVCAVIQKE
jgi:hypothetical protein